MALQKQPVSINFAQGMNQKADPWQLPIGQFQSLQNSVFDKAGRLTKRNGFNNITTVQTGNPGSVSTITDNTTLTTYNDNLIATGTNLYGYSADAQEWLNKGICQPVEVNVQSMVRSSTAQSSPDAATASNGLTCLVYLDSDGNNYYQISDSQTGNQVVARTLLPSSATQSRVAIVGNYFIITFHTSVPSLKYIAIPINNVTNPGSAQTISTNVQVSNFCYDTSSTGQILYIAWMGTSNTLKVVYLTNALVLASPVSFTPSPSSIIYVATYADPVTGTVWVAYCPPAAGADNPRLIALNASMNSIMAETNLASNLGDHPQIGLISSGQLCTAIVSQFDTGATGSASPYEVGVQTVRAPASGGGTGVHTNKGFTHSISLASKPFMFQGTIYYLVVYGTAGTSNQPSYFLMDTAFNIYARIAYSNGGGIFTTIVLPNVSLFNGQYSVPYQIADFLASVNKDTNLPSGTPTAAIYTQTGINLAFLTISSSSQHSSEIAQALHLTGGQLWEYDGVKPVEHGFHVWPEGVAATGSGSGGHLPADTYYYQFTYEWTDNQGMLHRSAPSIPVTVTTTGSVSSVTFKVQNLCLTQKIAPNPVRIVGYRWSTTYPVYYQFTSVTSPTLNDYTTAMCTSITDTAASVLGNTILYTTGGVVENIAAPPSIDSALFNNRLWLIDAEDRNLLWFSKQVIENTPVEMSDLLTFYVAPTTGAQGSTGPVTAISAMDDKLIIFKKDAIYYVNGTGPDNTGANSQYSDAIFITAAVGCGNPNSIVLMPNGLMFQSDKGIWLLGRDLSTNYIGAPVEDLSLENTVVSALAIPATNQVRFILDNSETLMYDYFYNQWAVHTNVEAISSTLYNSAHTYLNSLGQVYQETPGAYLDGSTPVLMSLTTSWISVAGLQGYERFYAMNLLGTYFTPFKLNVSLAYNYNTGPLQSVIVTPSNQIPAWGGEANWGSGGGWGTNSYGDGNVFSARVFPQIQKCETFQVSIQEVYDSSYGAAAGEGLSLSGMLLLVGVKRGSRTQSARKSFG